MKVIRPKINPLFIYDGPFSISFDDEGDAIIAGSEGIVKINEHGNIVASKTNDYQEYYKVLYSGGHIFAVGREYEKLPFLELPIRLWLWYIYVYNKDLNLMSKVALGKGEIMFSIGRLSSDGNNIYIAGSINNSKEPFDMEWVIYSINIKRLLEYRSQTSISGKIFRNC